MAVISYGGRIVVAPDGKALTANINSPASGTITLAQSASISFNTGITSATHFLLIRQGTPTTDRGYFAYARSSSSGFALYKNASGVACYDSELTSTKITISITNGVVSVSSTAFAFEAATYDWYAW